MHAEPSLLILATSTILFTLIAIIYYTYCDIRHPGEPPLFGGWIPVIGIALDVYFKGFKSIVEDYSKRAPHGVFTAIVNKQRVTFISHPSIIHGLPKLEKKGVLDNFPFRYFFLPLFFGDGECRAEVVKKYWSINGTADIWALFHRKVNLEHLTRTFQLDLEKRMSEHLVPRGVWKQCGLLQLIADLFLPITTQLLLGSSSFFNSQEFVTVMMTFNDNINAAQRNQHPNANPVYVQAKRELIRAILAQTESNDSDCFEAIQTLLNGMDEAGFNENEKATTILTILWASNMNAVISAFWVLYYVLQDSVAAAAIKAEVEHLAQTNPGESHITLKALKQMAITESACLEAMRISSANILSTQATEDFVLAAANETTYKIRKGDHLTVSTGQIHYDATIFPDPVTYKYDRFYDAHKHHSSDTNLLVFSHGRHKCPGRFFAMNELKILFSMIFTRIEIDLCNQKAELDYSYYGVGSMKPKQDICIRYRVRENSE